MLQPLRGRKARTIQTIRCSFHDLTNQIGHLALYYAKQYSAINAIILDDFEVNLHNIKELRKR